MKKLSMALFAVLLFACKTGEEPKEPVYNDLYSDNLKGDVVSVETTPYKVDSTGQIGEMDTCCIDLDTYDTAGYIVSYASKDNSGKVKTQERFTHFENGRMKEIATSTDGKMSSRLDIQIDSAGNYISATRYDSAGNVKYYYTDLSQNKYGNVLAGKELNPDSSLHNSWKSTYNDRYFAGYTNMDSTGKPVYESVVEVDSSGNRIKMTTKETSKDSTVEKVITYRYDEMDDQGNWTQRTVYTDGKPTKVEKRVIAYANKE